MSPTMEITVSGFEIMSQFFGAAADLVGVVGELAAKHIYLDPYDAAPDGSARSYCSLCLRYGLGTLAIDHAESCLVGRAIRVVANLQAQIAAASNSHNSTERTSASSSSAPVEQGGVAAEGAVRVPQHPAGLRVEYFTESPRDKFNPYTHPCPSARGRRVCEMELGHPGDIHSNDGVTWSDHLQGAAERLA